MMAKVLLIGYGNVGRLDDGLGPALAAAVERSGAAGVTVDADYQLQVEDAETVRHHDIVIFADAAAEGPEPFFVREVEAGDGATFTTHSVSPEDVVGLSRRLFQAKTRAFVLGIRGYEFDEFGERLSARARDNLRQALRFLDEALSGDTLTLLSQRTKQATSVDGTQPPEGWE